MISPQGACFHRRRPSVRTFELTGGDCLPVTYSPIHVHSSLEGASGFFVFIRGAVPSRREIIYPSDFYVCIAGGRAVGPLLCRRVAKNTEARADKSDCFRNNSFSEFLSNLFRGFHESSEGASRAKQKYLYPGRPSNWVINCRLHATISEWETKWSNCSQGNIIMSRPS